MPSVTQIIGEWITFPTFAYNIYTKQSIDIDRFITARETGKELHALAKKMVQGEEEFSSIPSELMLPIYEYKKWIADYHVKPIHIETPIFSKKLNVAGTPDLICRIMNDDSRIALVEIKTGLINEMARVQLATYKYLARNYYQEQRAIDIYELILPRSGKPYKFKKHEQKYIVDFELEFFMSRLSQFNFLERRRKK
mgnify:FL=1